MQGVLKETLGPEFNDWRLNLGATSPRAMCLRRPWFTALRAAPNLASRMLRTSARAAGSARATSRTNKMVNTIARLVQWKRLAEVNHVSVVSHRDWHEGLAG